jgi:hypothetical protein
MEQEMDVTRNLDLTRNRSKHNNLSIFRHNVTLPAVAVFNPAISLSVRVKHHGTPCSCEVEIEVRNVAGWEHEDVARPERDN